jgi:peptide/nickel transport system substrate-binding protein
MSLYWNVRTAPFDDVRARQALAYAFDAEDMNEAVYDGQAELADSMFDPSSPFYADVEQIQPDPERAQELLDELAAEGKPLEFTILSAPVIARLAEWLQARLSSFENITVKLENIAQPEAVTRALSGDFQLTFSGNTRFLDPYPTLFETLASDGGYNQAGISDPDLDAAVAEAQSTNDPEARAAAYETVQSIVADQVWLYYFMRLNIVTLFDPDTVGAFPVVADGLPDWSNVWLRDA